MPQESQSPANILWIMADDASWGDIGCFGSELIETPNIDRIAAEGCRFTACYSGSTVCAPARSSLMQGLHQGHATVRNNSSPGGYRHSLQPGDMTVAEVLKGAGYATGLFGKWGLACWDQPGVPRNMGFDEHVGYLNQRHAHNYYPSFLYHNGDRMYYPQQKCHDYQQSNEYDADGNIRPNGVEHPEEAVYSFDVYSQASERWLREVAGSGPFFGYLAYTLPHMVLEVPSLGQYADRDWPIEHRIYAAMVTHMDSAIGRVLDILDETGEAENTLVIWTSDNGYSHAGFKCEPTLDEFFDHSGPFKGRKGNLDQGGVRVPTVARWPGVIEPGRVSNDPWYYPDLMPTAAEIADVACPETDGSSLVPLLRGDVEAWDGHEYLYWEHGNAQAVRYEQWFATRPHPEKPLEIYHADEDKQQEHDLAPDNPELVAQIEAMIEEAHEPTIYFPEPGQPADEWRAEAEAAGLELPENIGRF
ncbi:MAG: arylsulfatase [Armatimonadota bacterium]